MQVPRRRSEQKIQRDTGPFLVTEAGLARLHKTLKRLEDAVPAMIAEVEYTKSHGDFSENAAYQDAKHTLRRTYGRIESVKDRIKRAQIIKKDETKSGIVQIGSVVTLETKGKRVVFEILGSHESDPGHGRISNTSPLGQKLLGRSVGDVVSLDVKASSIEYKIIAIN